MRKFNVSSYCMIFFGIAILITSIIYVKEHDANMKRQYIKNIKQKNDANNTDGPLIKRDLAKNPHMIMEDTKDLSQAPLFPNDEFNPIALKEINYSPFM